MTEETITSLTTQDCLQIISKHTGQSEKCFEIFDYQLQKHGQTTGYMAEHLLLTINYRTGTQNKAETFFVKRFPFNDEFLSVYTKSCRAFEKEIFAYQVLFEQVKLVGTCPRLYFSKPGSLLVFEDLANEGYITTCRKLDHDHVSLAVKALAKYHASTIRYQFGKSKQTESGTYCLLQEFSEYLVEHYFVKDDAFLGYQWFKARLNSVLTAASLVPNPGQQLFEEKLLKLAEDAFAMIKPSAIFLNTICHGDTNGLNVMYKYRDSKPIGCKLIDFQTLRYCPPAHDVLQFVFYSTTPEYRNANLTQTLEEYYLELRTELGEDGHIFSREEFHDSVKYFLPLVKLQTALKDSFSAANGEFLRKISGHREQFRKFAYGGSDAACFVEELFRTDENYRNVMIRDIEELRQELC